MSLAQPRTIYGVHSLTMYDRSTFLPFGILKVVGGLNLGLTGQFTDLNGGSSRYAWDSEPGVLTATLTGTIKEYTNFAFERLLGATTTDNGAESSGNVTTLTNKNGTSLKHATTGVASVSVLSASKANLKDGLYVLKCTGATEVTLFAMTDADFANGTNGVFADDDLSVGTPLTITSGSNTDLAGYGLRFSGGSGTIGMTTGDTAYFYVRKVNTGSSLIIAGAAAQQFSEFGAYISSQVKGGGGNVQVQAYKCKAIGLPLNFAEQAWMNSDFNMTMLYDSAEDAVFRIQSVEAAA